MQLFNNGIALETCNEHEIIVNNALGMDVTIIDKEGNTTLLHNITEVHHMYHEPSVYGESIAFESDIHSGGCTKRIKDLLVVSISPSTMRHDYYC